MVPEVLPERGAVSITVVKTWIATRLRFVADRIDPAGAWRGMSYSFTFERGEGISFNERGRGCPMWYTGTADYERAHAEARKPL